MPLKSMHEEIPESKMQLVYQDLKMRSVCEVANFLHNQLASPIEVLDENDSEEEQQVD